MNNKNKIKQSAVNRLFLVISYIVTAFFAIICVLPFIMVVSGSLSNNDIVTVEGYSLIPKGFTLAAYQTIFRSAGTIIQAYKITILVTLAGTIGGVFITAMGGYVLSRKDFKYRNQVSMFVYFTSIFSGGMIPTFLIITKVLHMYDSIWALILPGMTGFFNIFLFRNFVNGIPDSLVESARIDGAGDFTTFLKIIMPISKPAIATISLFTALGYWNDWYRSSVYISDSSLYQLQYLLYKMLLSVSDALKSAAASGGLIVDSLPTETLKLATAVVSTGPVLLFYPFAQKYFVGGLTIGSVKG